MPFHHFHRLTVALLLATTSLLHADALQVSSLTKSQQLPLSKSDRAAQEVNLGWIPSELTGEGLKWMGLEGEVPSWDDLRGQIIVLQSFRAPSPQIKKVREAIEGLGTNEVNDSMKRKNRQWVWIPFPCWLTHTVNFVIGLDSVARPQT
jgi:hypothetical protein